MFSCLASVAGVKRKEKRGGGGTKDGLVGHIHYIHKRFSFCKFSTRRNNIHTYLPPALFLRPLLPRPPLGGVGGSWYPCADPLPDVPCTLPLDITCRLAGLPGTDPIWFLLGPSGGTYFLDGMKPLF